MTSYRVAVRRTQKDIDAAKAGASDLGKADRKTLQALAKKRGIPGNQSNDALRKALTS